MSEQDRTDTRLRPEGEAPDTDVLDQVLDDAAVGDEPNAFDADAGARLEGNTGQTDEPDRGDNEDTIPAAF